MKLTGKVITVGGIYTPKAGPSPSTPKIWSAPTCRSFKTDLAVRYPEIRSEEKDIRSI
jgi:hypothetical protein